MKKPRTALALLALSGRCVPIRAAATTTPTPAAAAAPWISAFVGPQARKFTGTTHSINRLPSLFTDNKKSTTARELSSSTEGEISYMTVATKLDLVQKRIGTAAKECGRSPEDVRLVAVSKTKPLELLMEAYEHGQRVFGENYVQELIGKASEMPNDVVWHYIGPLQSNKSNLLVKNVLPYAAELCVETVATEKLANKLNKAVSEFEGKTLKVFVQVNTSGEESKSGVTPGPEVIQVAKHIVESCENLKLIGLMTIGAPGDVSAFDVLSKCRDETQEALGLSGLELSMGMSGDFEKAVEKGATNVRVGSTIFGNRDYSNKA